MRISRKMLGKTLTEEISPDARREAMSLRRQKQSFFRLLESFDGEGFEFASRSARNSTIS